MKYWMDLGVFDLFFFLLKLVVATGMVISIMMVMWILILGLLDKLE